MNRGVQYSVFAVLLVSMLFSSGAKAQGRQYITIGTGGPTGVYFVVGNAICRMVHKEAAEGRAQGRRHGIRCAAPSSAGSTYNIGQVSEGELDFGVAQSDWQYHSYYDTSSRVIHYPGLRSVFSIHPEPYQVIVHRDAQIQSFRELAGYRFNIGNPGSGQRGTTEILMAAYRMGIGDFAQTTELSSTEHSNALCDGRIDAFAFTVGVPNAGVAVATEGCGARIISLDTSVERALVANTPYYAAVTIPRGTYTTTDEDVYTFGVLATLVTSSEVLPSVVYEVVRAVFENIEDFRRLHPAFRNLDPYYMTQDGLSAPLHVGALRYYHENKWFVPDCDC